MPTDVAHLVTEILKDPARIDISPKQVAVERIDQRVYFVPQQDKRALLIELLADAAMKRVIVFTRTKHGANKVAEQLGKAGHAAEAIHGNKSQNARQKALNAFKAAGKKLPCVTMNGGGDPVIDKGLATGAIYTNAELQFEADMMQSFAELERLLASPTATGKLLSVPVKTVKGKGA